MKLCFIGMIIFLNLAFAKIIVPDYLANGNFETYEYQLFITNTKAIPIDENMTSKIVFEGKAVDYYKKNKEVIKQKISLQSGTADFMLMQSGNMAKSSYLNDVSSLQNAGIALVGVGLLDLFTGIFFSDQHYVQVVDFYNKEERPTTRIIKYLVSDARLGKTSLKAVFDSTNTISYHYRSGGFRVITKFVGRDRQWKK